MAVEVDKVQPVHDGYGFNIKATRTRCMTLIYETDMVVSMVKLGRVTQ